MFELEKIKSEVNRKYVQKHLRDIEVRGLSERRRQDVYMRLRRILNKYIKNRDFFKLSQEEVEDLAIALQKNLKSWHSIASYVSTLRRFIRVNLDLESNEAIPKQFRALRTPANRSKYKIFKDVEDIITPEQAFRLVNNAKNRRDAFIFMVLLDCGLRPHELMKAERKDIECVKDSYWYIRVPAGTKTGFRKVRMILSIPFADDYLKILPKKQNTKLVDISQTTLIQMIKGIADVNPYALRHSSASFYAKYLNEAELCERYGWIIGSKQTRTYVHLSQKELDAKLDKTIRLNNGHSEENDLQKLSPKFCLNCGSYSNFDSVNCRVCKQSLDPKDEIIRETKDKIAVEVTKRFIKIHPKEFEEIANKFGASVEWD